MASAPLTEVEHVLHAIRPDRRMQDYLGIGPDEPCLLLARRTWSGRLTATRSIFVFPGDRYSLGGRYQVMGEAERPTLGSIQTGQVFGASARGQAQAEGRPAVSAETEIPIVPGAVPLDVLRRVARERQHDQPR